LGNGKSIVVAALASIGARLIVYEKEKQQSERARASGAFPSSAALFWRMKARARRKKGERMEKT